MRADIDEDRLIMLVHCQSNTQADIAAAYRRLWNSKRRPFIDWGRVHRIIRCRWAMSGLDKIQRAARKKGTR